jgi:hypothetical protein
MMSSKRPSISWLLVPLAAISAATLGPACSANESIGDDRGNGGSSGGGSGGGAATSSGGNGATSGCESCKPDQFCALGSTCAPKQDPCATNDDCWFDSYCENSACIPYETPPEKTHDPSCRIQVAIDAIVPAVQCRWTGPPPGDAHPEHYHVMSTPIVVDLDLDGDPKTLKPSIVFTSFPTVGSYGQPGVLRIVDGGDCSQQFSLSDPADATGSPASAAAGDLDGDGRAEIVATTYDGGLIAFRFDLATKSFARLWRSGTCPGGSGPPTTADTPAKGTWSGPAIHDLDDDGTPEIISGGMVYRADGCLASSSVHAAGIESVIADVDADGKMELVHGDAIYEWTGSDWTPEPYFIGTGLANGQVAVADMGQFPLASQGGQDRAEVVVISGGTARVQTIEGTVVFGPVTVPGGGGGPPTIADFDGDGRPEFATAGGGNYVVFDFDCLANGNSTDCGGQPKTDGVLWTQPSQDKSSGVTGSSVFDFDANGSAEAVYADECFLRVYEGATGKVLYSAARSSGTTYENPVIVDVDGDYRTEIVSSVNNYAGDLGCPATDPLLPSASFEQNHGIVVLRDAEDRWAASRPIWNQHAYAVTHVGDLGQIPKSSAVKPNWMQPGLNNFRQNVQGDFDPLGVPDLTAGGEVGAVKCDGSVATIEARVCNRGALPMVSGTEVSFFESTEAGSLLCTAQIPIALQVAECTVVSCQADLGGKTVDVFVKVDPQSLVPECYENNNAALYKGVGCGLVPS